MEFSWFLDFSPREINQFHEIFSFLQGEKTGTWTWGFMEKTRDFVYNQCKTRGHQFRIDQSQQLFASYCFKRVISRVISRKIHDFTWFHYNDKKKAKNHQKTQWFHEWFHTQHYYYKKVCRDEKTKKFFNQASDFSVKITRDFFERSVKKKNHSECHIKKNHCWTVYVCVGPSC